MDGKIAKPRNSDSPNAQSPKNNTSWINDYENSKSFNFKNQEDAKKKSQDMYPKKQHF